MRYSTTVIVAALSVGQTLAGPTHVHLHRHAKVHEKKDVDFSDLDWASMGIDWAAAWSAGQHSSTAAAPVATSASAVVAAAPAASTTKAVKAVATSSKAATPSASSSAVVSDISSSASTAFSAVEGLANALASFGTATQSSGSDVAKIGNIGSPQGSNIIKVNSRSGYDFTNEFENTSSGPISVFIWNKAFQQNGNIEANLGSCVAPQTPALSFTLPPGATQIVAFQEDSQGAWAEATDSKSMSGAFDQSWGEYNFASTGSGYDLSSIMNTAGNVYDMSISAVETDCISDMTQNMWIGQNNNPEDPVAVGNSDGSCYIPGSTATLTTKMGGSKS